VFCFSGVPMKFPRTLLERFGRWLALFLSRPRNRDVQVATNKPEELAATLQKGDVLLVEGTSRFSVAIKYLTQSTWSHAALFIGEALDQSGTDQKHCVLVEADVNEGVRAVPLKTYYNIHTRICRPVGLSSVEIDAVADYAVKRLGHQYDLKNVLDLARYLIQTPPVPRRWKRQLLALGSGDPTRAICSSLIAQAFQSIRYPILPQKIITSLNDSACRQCYRETLHIRHHSLFAPRDFDVSPYFQIIKPTLSQGFDPHNLDWEEH